MNQEYVGLSHLSIAFDYMQIPALPIQLLVKVLMLSRGLMDYLARLKMNANYQERWGINNLMYITKTTITHGCNGYPAPVQ